MPVAEEATTIFHDNGCIRRTSLSACVCVCVFGIASEGLSIFRSPTSVLFLYARRKHRHEGVKGKEVIMAYHHKSERVAHMYNCDHPYVWFPSYFGP